MVRDRQKKLAVRLRQLREELYGEDGTWTLAEAIGIPVATWGNYESGVTLPALVLLALIEVTGVNPRWLASGQGEMLSGRHPGGRLHQGEGPSGPYLSR